MKKLIIAILMLSCIAACRKVELYHDLSEEEANEILVVLQQDGISASKIKETRQNEVFWTIEVESKRLNDARRLLLENDLPRKKELGLSGVYKEKGLIPTPDEQKARYLLALKGEIINSLKNIPDVMDADVVLNVPTQEEFASPTAEKKRPTASVVIKAKASQQAQEALSEGKIQQFVANTVENLNPRDVSVIITYLSQPKPGLMPGQSLILPSTGESKKAAIEDASVTKIAGLEVVSASQGRLKIYLAVFFVILALLGAALVFTVIKASRMRQELKEFKGDTKLIEGKVVEDSPRLEGKR
jgi:type III secretion protein J